MQKVIIKNFAPFKNCIAEISNTQFNNVKDIDVVMPFCNLQEYIQNYSKNLSFKIFVQIPALEKADAIVDFTT